MAIYFPNFSIEYARPIRRLWIQALRSGEYKQAHDWCLVNQKGECCIFGVLCEVFYKRYPGRVKRTKDEFGRTMFDGDAFMLPNLICGIVGLNTINGAFCPKYNRNYPRPENSDGCPTLVDLHDVHAYSFAELADIIEDRDARVFFYY